MAKPIVAVVGRPNVGKSTFFNKMAGARISIVEDTPGVTRDRVYADVSWQNYDFTLVDTGGIDPYSDDPLLTQMRAQANIAIETADVILFFVDGREGLTGADYEVADMLRRTKKPVLLVVNKLDTPIKDVDRMDFFALGIGEPLPISSVNLLGIGDLLEELCKLLPDPEEAPAGEDEEGPLKIAVVGRPNVGKSSLVNAILGQERVMVSDIAGTTRDAIDTPFRDNGRDYIIIDTAGIRRKAKVKEASLERYSVIRSLAAIRRCDCALLLIDARTASPSRTSGWLATSPTRAGPASSWSTSGTPWRRKRAPWKSSPRRCARTSSSWDYAPLLFISAKTGQRVNRLLPSVNEVCDNARRRITTGLLNDALHDAISVTPPPSDHGRRLRIYYATQASVAPPTYVLFVNDKDLFHYSYERYLENHFRKSFNTRSSVIRILVRERGEKED